MDYKKYRKKIYIDLKSSELVCKPIKKNNEWDYDCVYKLGTQLQKSWNKNLSSHENKLTHRIEGRYHKNMIDLGGSEEYQVFLKATKETLKDGIAEIITEPRFSAWTEGMSEELKNKNVFSNHEDVASEVQGALIEYDEMSNHGINNLLHDFKNSIGKEIEIKKIGRGIKRKIISKKQNYNKSIWQM